MPNTIENNQLKDCCKVLSDRKDEQIRPDLSLSVCQTCGCRHFELSVDPGVIGLKGF